jgi:hypothetical protein
MILELRLCDSHDRLQYLPCPGGRVAEIYHACLRDRPRVLLLLLDILLLLKFGGGKFSSALNTQLDTVLACCVEIGSVLALPGQRPQRGGIVP